MKNVAIIGCGYLGMKIASLFTQKKWHVTATTRKSERLPELASVASKGVILKGANAGEIAISETIRAISLSFSRGRV